MKVWFLTLLLVSGLNVQGQAIPEWFLKEIASEIGIWVADNSKYVSEDEPSEHYAIEWEITSTKTELVGRLFGMKNGKELGTFWRFRKYWDHTRQVAILEQVATDGTKGSGPFSVTSEHTNELIQTFTDGSGNSWKIGHRTIHLSAFRHVGSSYSIDDQGNWTLDRSYTWTKQSPSFDDKPLKSLEYMIGSWHAIPADSSFSSIITYQFSEGKDLILTKNQLFDRKGNEIGTYEGAYYAHDGQLGFYVTSPSGEVQIGQFEANPDQVVHRAVVSPGDRVKSYKSIMEFKLGKLYYHANYSSSTGTIPEHVPLNNPLIYLRLNKED
jgi:hypothetical protein